MKKKTKKTKQPSEIEVFREEIEILKKSLLLAMNDFTNAIDNINSKIEEWNNIAEENKAKLETWKNNADKRAIEWYEGFKKEQLENYQFTKNHNKLIEGYLEGFNKILEKKL